MPPMLSSAPPPARSNALSYLSLFTSLGTLLCCALPSLLVLFGLGATVASVLSEAPWLVTMSHHKQWVFIMAGALISSNFVYVYAIAPKLQRKNVACDPSAQPRAGRPVASAGLCFGARRCCTWWDALPHTSLGLSLFGSIRNVESSRSLAQKIIHLCPRRSGSLRAHPGHRNGRRGIGEWKRAVMGWPSARATASAALKVSPAAVVSRTSTGKAGKCR